MFQVNGRTVVETTIGEREAVGELASVTGRMLICLRSEWNPGDEDREGDVLSGYYSDWSEPTTEEQASPAYVALTARITAARAEEARETARAQANARAEYREQQETVAAMKASGVYDKIVQRDHENDARAAMFAAAGITTQTQARNAITLGEGSNYAPARERLANWQAQLDAMWTPERQATFIREQLERDR